MICVAMNMRRPWKGTVSYENAQNSSTSDNTASDHGPAGMVLSPEAST